MVIGKNSVRADHIFGIRSGHLNIQCARLGRHSLRVRVNNNRGLSQQGLGDGVHSKVIFTGACEKNDLPANHGDPNLGVLIG